MVVRIGDQRPKAILFQICLGAMMCLFIMEEVTAVQGSGQSADTKSDSFQIGSLAYIPSGKDFYRKYIRHSRPVLIQKGVSKWPSFSSWKNASTIARKYKTEKFPAACDGENEQSDSNVSHLGTLEYWLSTSVDKNMQINVNIKNSKILEDIYLPTILQCKEMKLEYENFKIMLMNGKSVGELMRTNNEMLFAAFGPTTEVLLADRQVSTAMSLKSRSTGKIHHSLAILNEGDLLYVPKYWWIQIVSSKTGSLGIKMPFDAFNFDGVLQERGIRKRDHSLEAIELHESLIQQQPLEINCTGRTLSLRHVLKINESDPKTLQLRIPKKSDRVEDVLLASGYKMPVLGLGMAYLEERTAEVAKNALELGYRMFDSAQGYPGSEEGLAQAMMDSSVPRSEIFIVTKLHPRYLGYNSTIKAIDMSLQRLNIEYIDLFLIHSKECDDFLLKCEEGEPPGTWQESWKAMEDAQELGKIRSLGVSNFHVAELKELLEIANFPVSVVQNWFDPIHQDSPTRQFCGKNGIRYMGYSTLGGMWTALGLDENPILKSSLLTDLSTHYDYFVPSVVLRWAIQKNVTVIPRSSNKNHLAQNLRALDTRISELDIKEIDSMATILDDVLQDVDGEGDENDAGGADKEGLNKDLSEVEDLIKTVSPVSAEEQPNKESLESSKNKQDNVIEAVLKQDPEADAEERPNQDDVSNPDPNSNSDEATLEQHLKKDSVTEERLTEDGSNDPEQTNSDNSQQDFKSADPDSLAEHNKHSSEL